MYVDIGAINMSLDGMFLLPVSVQILFCTYLLIRTTGKPLPIRPAVFALLGGMILQLSSYATLLAEDSGNSISVLPNVRALNIPSARFKLVEELLGTFGYVIILTSVLLMFHQSGLGTKNEPCMKKVVTGGVFVLLSTLVMGIASAANNYQTSLAVLYQGIALEERLYVQPGLSITSLIVSIALIVVLALGGCSNTVHRLRTAILFGLIPASLVQISLSAIYIGLYYSRQHHDILLDPVYVYINSVLSRMAAVTIPTCVLYAGYRWNTSDPSYTMQSSKVDIGRESSTEGTLRNPSVEDVDRKSYVKDMDEKY